MTMLNHKRSFKTKLFDWFNITMLLFFSCVMLYPLIYVFSISISDPLAVTHGSVFLWPVGFDTTAYRITIGNGTVWNAYKNTIIYVSLGTLIVLLLNTLAAYPLSRKNFYGRKVIMIFFSITMFFSGGLIPTYLLISKLKMIDTIWVMLIPGAVGAWNIIIFRTNFSNIPEALIESVKIDGGSEFLVYRKIILPLSKPIIATICLFTVVAKWNNFFTALIYITDSAKLPLQNYLRTLIVSSNMENIQNDINLIMTQGGSRGMPGLMESIKMAAIVISLGPILLAYPFVQKYFVKGVLVGSIKG